MFQEPSEQEIEEYISGMDNIFPKILADLEELPSFSLFNKSRVTQKLYLILYAIEHMVKNSDATLDSMKFCVEAINDDQTYKQARDNIRDYCAKCLGDIAQPENALAVHNTTTSSRFFAASSSSKNEDLEENYKTALSSAREWCQSTEVDTFAFLKTESNTKELTAILNLMIWRAQGILDDDQVYNAQADILVAALFSKTESGSRHQDVFKLLSSQHWFIGFALLLFSIAMRPIVLAILDNISPQNQDGFQP
jgi:hypothetical protein